MRAKSDQLIMRDTSVFDDPAKYPFRVTIADHRASDFGFSSQRVDVLYQPWGASFADFGCITVVEREHVWNATHSEPTKLRIIEADTTVADLIRLRDMLNMVIDAARQARAQGEGETANGE